MPVSDKYLFQKVKDAATRINGHVIRTPIQKSQYLSQQTEASVYLKMECHQITGSVKLRGVFNKLLQYRESGVMPMQKTKFYATSTGNHGIAMAFATEKLGGNATIYATDDCSTAKQNALRMHGATIRKCGYDIRAVDLQAQKEAKNDGAVYVSSYTDIDVYAAQGTTAKIWNAVPILAACLMTDRIMIILEGGGHSLVPTRLIGVANTRLELLEDCQDIDAVFVSLGGGGLAAGVSTYLKYQNPNIQIIGCSPINSNCIEQSVKAGKQIDIDYKATLADGCVGNLEIPCEPFEICQRNIDRFVNVTEEEISSAMFLMMHIHGQIIEGAAACSLACFLKVAEDFKRQNVAIVLCGRNVSTSILRTIINSNKHLL